MTDPGSSGSGNRPTSDEMNLARTGTIEARLALAERQDLPRELLAFMVADLAPEVRRRIAENPATPAAADLMLTRDESEDVRIGLVDKAAANIPDNTADEPKPLTEILVQILDTLASDTSDKIRLALSNAVADLRHAPHSTIKRLADDANPDVAGPVLSNSPVLEPDDLIATIDRCGEPQLNAIAARQRLPGSVAEALVAMGQDASIRTLLQNPSAHLREETLDKVLDQAPDHPSWHAALVEHPQLSRRAADMLATFIAESLIEALDEAEEMRCEIAARAAELTKQRLEAADDRVSEESLRAMIATGDMDSLGAGLASRAILPLELVYEILAAASPRTVLALAWAADLSMDFAVSLQSQVARIPPEAMLYPGADCDYPMSKGELIDQLKLLGVNVNPAERKASA